MRAMWMGVWLVVMSSSGCGSAGRADAGDGGADDSGASDASLDVSFDAGPTACAWGAVAPGPRPLFPWQEQPGDGGTPDGGSGCLLGADRNLTCLGRARVEATDAGPGLVFDDGSRLAWADERAGDLHAPHVPGPFVDVALERYVRRANPFGPLVETTTMHVREADGGRVLWLSRGGYAVSQALTDAEAVELFGLAPTYRPLCTTRFDQSVCWSVTRTFSEVELATNPGTVLAPNELGVVGGYQVRWTQSADEHARPPSCTKDDRADPTPDCSFTASLQGP